MEIHLKDIIFQIVNFAILMAVLTKFLYKPILKVLDDRAQKIKEGLDAAEKNISLQQETEDQRQEILSEAKKEAASIIRNAKKEAEDIVSSSQIRAKADAKKSLSREKQALAANFDRQLKQAESNLAGLVIKVTESVLAKSLDVKLQKSLVDKQIKELSKASFN